VIFNPSFPYRFVHMVLAAYLSTALVVTAVGAFHLLHNARDWSARVMFRLGLWMAVILAPVQIIVGDFHGLNTLEHQPAKIAAVEGHFETQRGAPLHLFGLPDLEAGETRYAISIPRLGSLILGHDLDAEITGLDAFPRDEWPNAPLIFWAFRIMVGIGLLMFSFALVGLVLYFRKRLYETRWYFRWALGMAPLGFVAIIAGWIVTEVGRQPYLVYGLLRTADGVSPIAMPGVAGSLAAFVIIYFTAFSAGIFYLLRLMRRTPLQSDESVMDEGPLGIMGVAPQHGAEEKRPDA
jgi:cytochrome d ubiquinol oxidase subunit I